jgi:hypothetical protein
VFKEHKTKGVICKKYKARNFLAFIELSLYQKRFWKINESKDKGFGVKRFSD